VKNKIWSALFSHLSIPAISKAEKIRQTFRPVEKVIFFILALGLLFSALALFTSANRYFTVEIPKDGGTLREGIVGFPRFINPLFAISDADRDLTGLVYSGLLSYEPGAGLVPNLAEDYQISDDGLSYTFKLKKDLTFQDGAPLTADDVAFTILKAQDPNLKSPKRPNWDGVKIEKIGDLEIRFTLSQPYAPFLENATLGILPKHLWQDVSADQFTFTTLNTEPVGSGPYKIKSLSRDQSGLPEFYELVPFKNYALGKPHILNLITKFYTTSDKALTALEMKELDSLSTISPHDALRLKSGGENVVTTALPRIFGIFFNQNQATIFANKEVRQALNLATNKDSIVEEVLDGYATKLTGPIPPGFLGSNLNDTASESDDFDNARLALATSTLEKNGWKKNTSGIYEKKSKKESQLLSFSIATANTPELKATADILKNQWQKIGAEVDIKIFEPGDLNQNVIRPRKYDALLFGEVVGRDLDLFAFWHSSQRIDPGLNIALYASIKADKLLSDGRKLSDRAIQIDKYRQFEDLVADDLPAIFLYSPDFIYVIPKSLQGLTLGTINTPAERFADIQDWYLSTERVWKIFAPKEQN